VAKILDQFDTGVECAGMDRVATMDVGSCLRNLGLERYEQAFIQNHIGSDVLPDLTEDIHLVAGRLRRYAAEYALISWCRACNEMPSLRAR
jgi:SAM domain (Sterile alpha motif)